jgi:hypothetical protein
MSEKPYVLAVDDSAMNIHIIEDVLGGDFEWVCVSSSAE